LCGCGVAFCCFKGGGCGSVEARVVSVRG